MHTTANSAPGRTSPTRYKEPTGSNPELTPRNHVTFSGEVAWEVIAERMAKDYAQFCAIMSAFTPAGSEAGASSPPLVSRPALQG